MGNEHPNYNTGYNIWAHYRNANKPQVQPIRNNQFKISQVTPIPKQQIAVTGQNKNTMNSNPTQEIKPVTAINQEQIKKSIPSVITGSKIAPMSQQPQQGHSRR